MKELPDRLDKQDQLIHHLRSEIERLQGLLSACGDHLCWGTGSAAWLIGQIEDMESA